MTKKDGGNRFCVDYNRINDVTAKDAYPLPRIDEMLASKQWFSTLDLAASGYWHIGVPVPGGKSENGVCNTFRSVPVPGYAFGPL